MEEVLEIVNTLHLVNKKRYIKLPKRHAFISTLHDKAKNIFNQNSQFMIDLTKLYNYNRKYVINIPRNNIFTYRLKEECIKEIKKSEEAKKTPPSVTPKKKISRKAALLIGINYKGTSHELFGCETDVYDTQKMLINKFGFKKDEIIILCESQTNKLLKPTKVNIMNEINRLVLYSQRGYSSLWFHFSGHGYYFRDGNGDEKDGYDECIVTSDHKVILDDELRLRFTKRIRPTCNLFCLIDCCHSGTMLDLKYKYNSNNKKIVEENKKIACLANIISLSGCRDHQTSADAQFGEDDWGGAMTRYFINELKMTNGNISYKSLLKNINRNLKISKFSQSPQLTCSRELDMDSKFWQGMSE